MPLAGQGAMGTQRRSDGHAALYNEGLLEGTCSHSQALCFALGFSSQAPAGKASCSETASTCRRLRLTQNWQATLSAKSGVRMEAAGTSTAAPRKCILLPPLSAHLTASSGSRLAQAPPGRR